MKKGLLALVPVLALAASAPAFAGESGTFGRTRTYAETGTRSVSVVGSVNEVSYSVDADASGVGAVATATGTYAVGTPMTTTATATAPGAATATSASADVVSSSMIGAASSNVITGTYTDTLVDTLTGVFSY